MPIYRAGVLSFGKYCWVLVSCFVLFCIEGYSWVREIQHLVFHMPHCACCLCMHPKGNVCLPHGSNGNTTPSLMTQNGAANTANPNCPSRWILRRPQDSHDSLSSRTQQRDLTTPCQAFHCHPSNPNSTRRTPLSP